MFVAIEGLDGSGKDSLATALLDQLQGRFGSVVVTSEPTSSPSGRKLRSLLSSSPKSKNSTPSPEEWTSLFITDRREHSAVLRKHLDEGSVVVCVRYDLSTYAYQGFQELGSAGGSDDAGAVFERMYEEHRYHRPGGCLVPDQTLYLDLPTKVALERIHRRQGERTSPLECFETTEQLNAIRRCYELAVAFLQEADGRRIERLDAEGNLESIANHGLRAIEATKKT